MGALQKTTNSKIGNADSDFVAIPWEELTLTQQTIVDYKALNGLITNDEPDNNGSYFYRMTVQELANKLSIDRTTVYEQIKSVPNFWDHVANRRKILGSQSRLARVHDAWFLKASRGDFQHLQLYLANFDPNFRMPTQKHEHDAGSALADLLNRGRERQRKAIEGEVIEPEQQTPNA